MRRRHQEGRQGSGWRRSPVGSEGSCRANTRCWCSRSRWTCQEELIVSFGNVRQSASLTQRGRFVLVPRQGRLRRSAMLEPFVTPRCRLALRANSARSPASGFLEWTLGFARCSAQPTIYDPGQLVSYFEPTARRPPHVATASPCLATGLAQPSISAPASTVRATNGRQCSPMTARGYCSARMTASPARRPRR